MQAVPVAELNEGRRTAELVLEGGLGLLRQVERQLIGLRVHRGELRHHPVVELGIGEFVGQEIADGLGVVDLRVLDRKFAFAIASRSFAAVIWLSICVSSAGPDSPATSTHPDAADSRPLWPPCCGFAEEPGNTPRDAGEDVADEATLSPPKLALHAGVPPKPETPTEKLGTGAPVPQHVVITAAPLAMSAAACNAIAAISQSFMKATFE